MGSASPSCGSLGQSVIGSPLFVWGQLYPSAGIVAPEWAGAGARLSAPRTRPERHHPALQKDASFAREAAKRSRGVPPTGLVLLSVGSVQFGAAIAKGLFDSLGPGGTVLLRISLAALVLLVLWRPKLGGYGRRGDGFAGAPGVGPGGGE